MSESFIIQGCTIFGEVFRPADWAERLAGALSTVKMRRLRYSPYLYPTIYEGYRALYVDECIEKTHPQFYKKLCQFMADNQLKRISL